MRAQPNGTLLYTTLAGEWGWTCPVCRAESRYCYGEPENAARLARKHVCKGSPRSRRDGLRAMVAR